MRRMAKPPKNKTAGRSVKISQAAQRNHEELFPNHQSILKGTDPELIEIFDNFAFDEVLAQSKFDIRTRTMMILASLIASQTVSEYKIMVGAALNVGVTPVEIKEILYQSVPYVGMAKAFDFLHATNEVLTTRGVSLPLEGQSTTTPETRASRQTKGIVMRVGILGSGLMGGKLGTLFARAGHEVVFSYARSHKRLEGLARDAGRNARAGAPGDAAEDADALLLAVHRSRMDDVLKQAGDLSGKVIVSCSLPMNADNTRLLVAHTSSGAEELAKMLPKARVVSAFNTVPSEVIRRIVAPLPPWWHKLVGQTIACGAKAGMLTDDGNRSSFPHTFSVSRSAAGGRSPTGKYTG